MGKRARLQAANFIAVKAAEPAKDFLAARSKCNEHLAAISGSVSPLHQATLGGTLDQTHHGIVPLLQEFGQFGDGSRARCGPVCLSWVAFLVDSGN
jgi:hypothetical protein